MISPTRTLAIGSWFGIGVAAAGVATVDAEVMATGMLAAGLLGLAWGYFTHNIHPDADITEHAAADGACPVCDHPFGELAHACIGLRDDESNMRPERRPVWDPDVMGAPE